MRDLRDELQDRAHRIAQQISAENARFESLISQLKAEQVSALGHLRFRFRLANKLIEFAAWEENLRAALAARVAVAEAAELSIQNFSAALNSALK